MTDILRPYISLGREITRDDIRRTINAIANVPARFETWRLASAILPETSDATSSERMEALNRFMQRLRRAGLASFQNKKWTIKPQDWTKIQQMVASSIGNPR